MASQNPESLAPAFDGVDRMYRGTCSGGLGPEWTHVRPGMFAGNLLDWSDVIRAEGVVTAPYDAAITGPVKVSSR